jgi:chromosome segregation ATPase
MRSLFIALLLLAPLAFAGSSHRTHIVDTDDGFEFRYVRNDSGERWASLEVDGVRYRTEDPGVLAQIEKAMEAHREVAREHSRLGRRHSELGREHSQLGREHSRLGREHSRVSRDRDLGEREVEQRQRELEAEQRKLEEKQRELESRQRELESEQRDLERRQRDTERAMHGELEKIFERAAREGKAKKNN